MTIGGQYYHAILLPVEEKEFSVTVRKYKISQLEMNLLNGNFPGNIAIGASTSIAQYVLPPILAKFLIVYPDIRLLVISGI